MAGSRLKKFLIGLRTSFWFLPGLIVLGAVALAFSLVAVDSQLDLRDWNEGKWVFGAGAEGSRHMLAAVATSMITIAGVTFSITMVVLSLAANQYTPRILRNFIRDRGNQIVLGVFVGIFSYCIVVLRSIVDSAEETFIPALAIFTGLVLALVGVAVFIYFIHHTATSVQATHILSLIAKETAPVIEELWPEQGTPSQGESVSEPERWHVVPLKIAGYVVTMDHGEMARLAEEHDLVIRLHGAPGDYVVEGAPLVSIDRDRPPDGLAAALEESIAVSVVRTIEQDPAFGIRQVIDIALKALSPGVNDVHTAVEALDHLTSLFARMASREEPLRHHFRNGELRVISCERPFAEMVEHAYRSIRNAGDGHVSVFKRLLDSLRTVADFTDDPGRRWVLAGHCAAIGEAVTTVVLERDRQPLRAEAERLAGELSRELPTMAPARPAGSHE